jgi:hypothetical protein
VGAHAATDGALILTDANGVRLALSQPADVVLHTLWTHGPLPRAHLRLAVFGLRGAALAPAETRLFARALRMLATAGYVVEAPRTYALTTAGTSAATWLTDRWRGWPAYVAAFGTGHYHLGNREPTPGVGGDDGGRPERAARPWGRARPESD